MEELRWIILAAGVVFIVLIYLFGRRKNKDTIRRDLTTPVMTDLPSISTGENNDEYVTDEYSVRTVQESYQSSGVSQVEINQELIEEIAANVNDGLVDALTYAHANKKLAADITETEDNEPESATSVDDDNKPESTSATESEDDLIIVYVVAGDAYFNGTQLAQFINQQQLKFGDMKLYHARDNDGQILFSMSNMIEPGYFEPEHLADMQTPGVIFFMQLALVNDTVAGFKRLQYAAQTLAKEFQGNICDAKRRLLDDEDFLLMQQKAERFQK